MKVLVDTREQKQLTFSKSKLITELEITTLSTGDYTIDGMQDILTIERKASTSEIANNITEKRWPDVLGRLSMYKYKFLVCEFTLSNILEFPRNSGIPKYKQQYVRISPAFMLMEMTKVQVLYGIPVIFAENRDNAEVIIENIFKRVSEAESG